LKKSEKIKNTTNKKQELKDIQEIIINDKIFQKIPHKVQIFHIISITESFIIKVLINKLNPRMEMILMSVILFQSLL
jgi:hypothetical protein